MLEMADSVPISEAWLGSADFGRGDLAVETGREQTSFEGADNNFRFLVKEVKKGTYLGFRVR